MDKDDPLIIKTFKAHPYNFNRLTEGDQIHSASGSSTYLKTCVDINKEFAKAFPLDYEKAILLSRYGPASLNYKIQHPNNMDSFLG